MKKIKIGNKFIGEGESCFIIAEAGVNHNGDLGLAKKLVDVAKEAGVDAVKFQTFKAENVTTSEARMAKYQQKNLGRVESQLEMIKKLELGYEDFTTLKNYCDKRKIIFLSTPHDEESVDFLEPLVPAYKVGSGDIINFPFLKKVARIGKPVVLSTGMSTMVEVKDALKLIKTEGTDDIVLLHCTTSYPCPVDEVNLRAMVSMREELNTLVGYSDHTLGIEVSVAAVALGAPLLEKHFTLNKDLPGPDHRASLEPQELKNLVEVVRDVGKALGSGIKEPAESERETRKVARKSLVAKVNLPKGTVITEGMITIKRPGDGIEPKYLSKVVGKRTKQDISMDELITWEKV